MPQLNVAVGLAALVAPALHSLTDVMEWQHGGFSNAQLWLNYLAFLPMSWLLLGLYAAHDRRPNAAGLVGALLYGAAFTYFAHTTLYALAEQAPTYEALWSRLGALFRPSSSPEARPSTERHLNSRNCLYFQSFRPR